MRDLLAALCLVAVFAAQLPATPPFKKLDLYRMARRESKGGNFARAAAAYEDVIRVEQAGQTIQIAVVCEAATLARLIDTAESEEGFFFLSTDVAGKRCFRALYGVYGSVGAAKRAVALLPRGMRDGKSPPYIIPVAKLFAKPDRPRSKMASSKGTRSPRGKAHRKTAFTNRDLTRYRKDRERANSSARPPAQPAVSGDPESYWKQLFDRASRTVGERKAALAKATKRLAEIETGGGYPESLEGDRRRAESTVKRAKTDLDAAEEALALLKEQARRRGADPSWIP